MLDEADEPVAETAAPTPASKKAARAEKAVPRGIFWTPSRGMGAHPLRGLCQAAKSAGHHEEVLVIAAWLSGSAGRMPVNANLIYTPTAR